MYWLGQQLVYAVYAATILNLFAVFAAISDMLLTNYRYSTLSISYVDRRHSISYKLFSLFTLSSILLLALFFALRSLITGKPAFTNQYEFSISLAFCLLLANVFLYLKGYPRLLNTSLSLLSLIVLVYSSFLNSLPTPAPPALQNNTMLLLHVTSALVAYSTLLCSALSTLLKYLCKFLWRDQYSLLIDRTESISYNTAGIAFLALGATLLFGSMWASVAWGYYWNWDPKETSTLATWLSIGAYLHTRRDQGKLKSRGDLFILVSLLLAGLTFTGNYFFESLHSYGGLQ